MESELPPNCTIPARSRRQVMDWGLVLASQEIEATIVRTDGGWGLVVQESQYERAQAALRQYREENRGWRWKQQLPGSGLVFHWGALVWVAAMGGFYYWTMAAVPELQGAGIMDGQRVAAGEWWRLFTAITLHENLPHLAANAATGFLLLGLAMARYGPGVALLAAFLAGAAGNVASLMIHSDASLSLGASGMVTGALGMLSVHSFSLWRKYRAARGLIARGAVAGFLILVLIGFSPGSDIAAHLGGFVAGAVIGLAMNAARPAVWQGGWANVTAALALAALAAIAWRQALAGS
jgi:membrane associated rhomboid family serine protease